MKCFDCIKTAAFTCPCKFVPLCSDHLNQHIKFPGKHSCEILEITLADSDSKMLRIKILDRIQSLEIFKSSLFSKSDRLIKLIENCTKIALQELECFIQLYSTLLTFTSFSTSLKLEVDKILLTDMKIKAVSVDITTILSNSYTQGLVTFVKNDNLALKIEASSLNNVDNKIAARKAMVSVPVTKLYNSKNTHASLNSNIQPKVLNPNSPVFPNKNLSPFPNTDTEIVLNTKNKSNNIPNNSEPTIDLNLIKKSEEFISPILNKELSSDDSSYSAEIFGCQKPKYEFNDKNLWPFTEKFQFMTSLNLMIFNSQVNMFNERTKEILFSNDEKYSFICKIYVGRHI